MSTISQKKQLFVDAYTKNNFNVSKGCKISGIPRTTYYRWRKQQKFNEQINDAVEHKKDLIEDALFDSAMSDGKGAVTAQMFLAKTLCKDRGYIEKQESEITHKGEGIKLIINQKDDDKKEKL